MRRVTGIGGIFFKSQDPAALKDWYERHLGVIPDQGGHVTFEWREKDDPDTVGYTVWGPFGQATRYFEPSAKPYMFNFRVADLDALLQQLRAEGVEVDDKVEEYEYGRFGWIMDPEGHRIELWEPPRGGETG